MDWHTAYMTQARSDYAVLRLLMSSPGVAACHRLHYLQMTTEKLGKGYLTPAGGERYPNTHDAFVRFLQTARYDVTLRRRFGMNRRDSFIAFVNSLLSVAHQIEGLSPEGGDHPNPEYPWAVGGQILVPAIHLFTELDFHNIVMIRLIQFIEVCLAE